MSRLAPRSDLLVMLLAGGQGERLYPLTKRRAKPAVPFAGLYRLIDFTVSNCLNSELRRIYVLTQHKSLSVDRHLRRIWGGVRPESGEFIQTVPPQQHLVARWYAGTADAVFQNLYLLEDERPERVLIVSGDHVYRMDYRRLLAFHAERGADVTLACTRIERTEAARMGVLAIDADARVQAFTEKPAEPPALPGDAERALVNMGVYVFNAEVLIRAVIADAKTESAHDFGRNILPGLVSTGRLYAFDVTAHSPPGERYWQDVGTIDSYYEANMALLGTEPSSDLFDAAWPVHTCATPFPPSCLRRVGTHAAEARDSLISPGCLISGASVVRSVLSPGVSIGPRAVVEEAILMPGVQVGPGARIRRAVIDENVTIPADGRIGVDAASDARRFTVSERGIAVVPEGIVVE